MPNDNGENEPLDPLSGRIIGAGSNQLQRSIDSLNYTLQRFMTLAGTGGGMGGGGGRPPAVTASASPMDPRGSSDGGGGALVLRGQVLARREERFPAAVTWDSQQGTSYDYQWGTPVRNAPGNQLPPRTGVSLRKPTLRGPNGGSGTGIPPMPNPFGVENIVPPTGPGGGGFNWRNAARNAQKISNKVGAWGAGLVKTGSVMDTYSQWAGIANGAPYSADGTNGGSVNAIRKFMFGSQGQNLIGWAQNAQDAQKAAFIASRNAGFTELTPGTRQTINPAFASYMGNIKDLSILNPTLNAAQTASMIGTLSSTRALYASQMYGYQSLLSPGGQINRNAFGSFTDSIMRRTFRGKTSIRPEELKASLGQNGSLHANIAAYVNSVGGDDTMTQAIEDYISGRNTAAQKGLGGAEFDKLLASYEKGGSAGEAAGNRLKKFGVSNTILQSQKDLNGAKTGNVSDLMDSLGPAVKRANEALKDFYNWLDSIVNVPGVKQTLGTVAGWGSVFGPALGSAFGAVAGMRLGGGALGTAGSLLGLRAVGGGAAGGAGGGLSGLLGGGGALGAAGVSGGTIGAAGLTSAIAAGIGWHEAGKEQNSSTGLTALKHLAFMTAGPFGQMAVGGSSARRAWDKLSGKNTESWWSLLNPFGHERTVGYDGRDGGASSKQGTKGSAPASGDAIAGKSAAGAISAALSEVGKPYLWGGTGPDAFDCSGLMQYAYKQIGVDLPRVSQDQMNVGKAVSQKDAVPGDLMFPHSGHVVMYLGDGKIVEAPRPGENIRVAPVSEYGNYVAIRRIVGSVGSYSGAQDQGANTQKSQTGNLGGDSGSMILSNDSGSTEEVDAVTAAIAGVRHTLLNSPMNDSSSKTESSGGSAPDLSGVDTSGPWKKDSESIKKAQAVGQSLAASMYNWTGPEWDALFNLWTGESDWRWWAENSDSGAYGIPQSLPADKMASAGKDWKNNPATQIKWGLNYIKESYGDPIAAYGSWKSRSPHWYNTGAWEIPEDQHAVVHKGEMIIEKPKADTIRQALMRDVVNVKDAASGRSSGSPAGSSGLSLSFHDGAVRFIVNGAMTESAARSAAATFANALAENTRLRELGVGL